MTNEGQARTTYLVHASSYLCAIKSNKGGTRPVANSNMALHRGWNLDAMEEACDNAYAARYAPHHLDFSL